MVALVGLCRDGSKYAWVAPDVDRADRDGVDAAEGDWNSLGGTAGPREPGRGLSRVPTNDERVCPLVSSEFTFNKEIAGYRNSASANSDDNWSRNRFSLAREVASFDWISSSASRSFDHRMIAESMRKYLNSPYTLPLRMAVEIPATVSSEEMTVGEGQRETKPGKLLALIE